MPFKFYNVIGMFRYGIVPFVGNDDLGLNVDIALTLWICRRIIGLI